MFFPSGQSLSNPKEGKDKVIANKDIKDDISNLNHVYPSVTSLWRYLPPKSFEPTTIQPSYLDAHYNILKGNEQSVCWESEHHRSYPVQLITDEQPLSQTTSLIEDNSGGELIVGLSTPLSYDNIMELGGIEGIKEKISNGSLNYISSVQEFRVLDVTGSHCSNPVTFYRTESAVSDQFVTNVKMVVELVKNVCLVGLTVFLLA